ncbi:type IV pilus secretin family protein [Coleofasciculus sp. FACHB-SPT36]|uniref:AMIN domain-containing protein n=1 Tax=Cyanophyceae TaxID=3028117 RepID=UPI00168BD3D4|nr:AMIN domain-containing protein [Coleofasciculus sp. FACHB-SPT36]
MKQLSILGGILLGSALVLPGTQRVLAAATQVTAVQLNPTDNGVEVMLKTSEGDRSGKDTVLRPQMFTLSRGNELTADVLNARLSLPEGDSFRQENPAPGIQSIVVSQREDNSVRVTVSAANSKPTGQISQNKEGGITLNVNSVAPPTEATPPTLSSQAPVNSSPTAPAPTAQTPPTPSRLAQTPVPGGVFPQTAPGQIPQVPAPSGITPAPGLPEVQPQPVINPPNPDVLVPNPRITIDGVPAPAAGTVQPVSPAPPFLPRAIAPPVGDITTSNTNAAPAVIDLGTAERVPRLVLRDAPVREVLGLLARSAGLNLAFTGGAAAGGTPGQPAAAPGPGGATEGGPTISLDIENEPVQDVFNYVLQLSGLEANRVGRTIFVGARLPDDARNIITRSLRLNQVPVTAAANFLTTQGAETQIPTEQIQIQTIGEGAAARTVEIRTPSILALRATEGNAPLLLKGLAVSADERLNAITLVGSPRKVEIATNLLTQLDARRRQVAVNVKVVDVNLLNTKDFNTSFSFGIGDSFFNVDRGAAVFNYGGVRPPTAAQTAGSQVSPTVIPNPFAGGNTFLDFNNAVPVPGTGSGTRSVIINPGNNPAVTVNETPGAPLLFPQPSAGVSGNPFRAGITDFTRGTPNESTVTTTPGTAGTPAVFIPAPAGSPPGTPGTIIPATPGTPATTTATFTAGTLGTVTTALPSFFQFPSRFLSSLQAQIQSGNAKILTDPTLVVQEGQSATVNLTQEVVGNIRRETETTENTTNTTVTAEIKQAGLILNIRVERIDDNGFVTLAVNPTVTAIGGQQNIVVGDDVNQIALLTVRNLNSGQLRLRDGQTLILSGIIQDSERTTVSKVPILGDIPLLGALFRSTNKVNQRQEVIVLLTPQIIDDSSRAAFGYSYTPGQNAREILERK